MITFDRCLYDITMMSNDESEFHIVSYALVGILFLEGKLYLNCMNIEQIPESNNKFFRKDNSSRIFKFLIDKENTTLAVELRNGGVKEVKRKVKNKKKFVTKPLKRCDRKDLTI